MRRLASFLESDHDIVAGDGVRLPTRNGIHTKMKGSSKLVIDLRFGEVLSSIS